MSSTSKRAGDHGGDRGEDRNTAATSVGTAESALEAAEGLDFLPGTSVNPEDLTKGGPPMSIETTR